MTTASEANPAAPGSDELGQAHSRRALCPRLQEINGQTPLSPCHPSQYPSNKSPSEVVHFEVITGGAF